MTTVATAGDITIEGYTIHIDDGAQILAKATTGGTDGSITINAEDERVDPTTGFANIDNVDAEVDIGLSSAVTISGGNVTIDATANGQHYFTSSDFQMFDITGSLTTMASQVPEALNGILGALESLSVFAGVTISKATAEIDIGQYAQVKAANFAAGSSATATAAAAPASWGLGVAYGKVDTTSNVTISGSITTSGNATIEATTNNTVSANCDREGGRGL